MKNKREQFDAVELRRQAEAKLTEHKKKTAALPVTEFDTQRLIHELEVHQIELEMQNEELVQSRAQVEAGLHQYTDLYDFAPIGYFTLASDGTIHQVNLAGAKLLGVERAALIKRRFGAFISVESRPIFNAFIENVFGSQQKKTCELQIQKDVSNSLWMHIEAIIEDGQSEACRVVVSDITERKQAEKALQESEERFRQFFEYETNYCYRISTEGTILDLNPSALRALGYASKDEIVGKPLLTTVYAPNSRDRAHQLFLRWKETGELHNEELSIITKTGEERVIILNVSVVRDVKGKMLHSVSIQTDITERKRAEEALKKSEHVKSELLEKLKEAQNLGMIGSWEWDLQTNHVWWSDETYRIFDVTPQDYVPSFEANGKFIHPDDFANYNKVFEHSLQTGEPLDFDTRLVTNDGLLKHCQAKGKIIYNDSGKPIRFIGTIMDVTERKLLTLHIEEERNKFASLISSIPDEIWFADTQKKFTLANPSAIQEFNLNGIDNLGIEKFAKSLEVFRSDGSLRPVEEAPPLRALAGEFVKDLEEIVRVPNRQELRYRLVNAVPVRDAAGSIIGAISVVRDITERKRAEVEILKLNRTYAVLSNINQLIVREQGKQRLFDGVCKIAIDEGKFLMSWIGMLDEVTGKVEPVASAGALDGYLDQLHITISDTPHGKGPTGTALREGRTVICDDIEHDERMVPWRKRALAIGYKSLAAFPLRIASKVIGTINLYSSEVQFFDKAEIHLLEELAADISYALETLKQDEQRMQAEHELRESEKRLNKINELQNVLLQSNPIEQKLRLITESIVQTTCADFARIWMIKPGDRCETGCTHAQVVEGPHMCRFRDRCLHMMASSGRYTHIDGKEHGRVPFGCYKIGKIAAGDEHKFLTNEVINDPRVHNHMWAKELGLVSFAGYRLVGTEGAPIGVLALFKKSKISADEDLFLQGIAHSTSQVLHSKLAEIALRESEKEFHSLAEAMPQIVWITRADGWNIYFNQQWVDYTGLTLEESYGHGWNKPFHPDDQQRAWDAWQNATNNGATYSLECRLRRADGIYNWWLVRGVPVLDVHGKILKWFGTCTDINEIKQAEEELKKSEEKYRRIFENVQDVYYETSFDGTILEVSPSIEFISRGQYHRVDLIGRSMVEFYADTESRDVIILTIQKKGSITDFEVRLKNRDGSIINCSISATISFNVEGQPEKIIGSMHDVTERKWAEELLQRSEHQYRMLFDEMTTGFAVHEIILNDKKQPVDYRFLQVNRAFEHLTGLSAEAIVGKTVLEVMSKTEQLFIQRYGEVALSGRAIQFESYSQELKKYYNIHVYAPELGKFATIFEDITERKQTEQALQVSEIKQNEAMDIAKLGTWDYDVASDQFTFNDQFYSLFHTTVEREGGYTMSSAQYAQKFVHPDDMAMVGLETQKALATSDPNYQSQAEHRIIYDDGKMGYITVRIRIEKDANGCTVKTFGVNQDITERKQMEEGLRQMQKLEGLGTLAGGIAHDFNNILGIILAYNSSIKKFKDDSKKFDLATETITKAVDRGRTLVQQILMFARKTETAFGAVNVNDVVMEIVNMIYEMFPKTVTCSQNFDKSISYINADRSQLHQVLMNLCVNARDAMPKGGVLSINTHMEAVTNLRNQHPEASESSYVSIEVSDTGDGMTEETKKRIFEPFFTTKQIGKGTGLGLSVVFGVVQTHKGFIDVESEPGKGTTFRLYFPASQVTEPIVEEKGETLVEVPGGTETLLLVEDEPMLLMSLQMILVDKGYKVLSAADGIEALQIYQENKKKIDLVITDLGLPTITGLEVCQRIKKINPKEHIVLATGFLDPEMKTEFLKEGIEHFLYKPYDLKKVLKVIREVIDGK